MIQDGTIVNITDNAGGKIGKVFKVLGSSKKRYATLGEKVIISVKVAEPRKGVKKKDVHQAVVVRTVKAYRRDDGSYISFDDNAVVILEKDKLDPKGGRVFGPIPRELTDKGYQKIISLAQEVI
jgi:large subunit ribosomal protein L14